mgnify:FL=1
MDHYRHHAIDVSDVKTVVLDEADEMLNMGFYKDVKYIIDLMKHRESLSMFSRPSARRRLDIGWLYQHNAAEVSVQPVEDSSPKIAQYKLLTTGRDKLADAAQIIIDEGYKRVMIFCNTKYNTGMLANQLARLNFNVDCLHGDLSQAERNRIMTRFKAGRSMCWSPPMWQRAALMFPMWMPSSTTTCPRKTSTTPTALAARAAPASRARATCSTRRRSKSAWTRCCA